MNNTNCRKTSAVFLFAAKKVDTLVFIANNNEYKSFYS